jgi:regulator of RNase E activity RraA
MENGYHISPMPAQLPAAVIEAFDGVSVATVGHLLWDGFLDHRQITARQPDTRIIGTAVTIRLPSPDTALLHYLTARLRPGDVVVIDRCGDTRMACLGGNVGLAMAVAGAAGAIVDGPICDPDEIREHGFSVWSNGVSPITTRRMDPPMGQMNVPVTCGGVTVHPGDVIIADESGVLCVPRANAMTVAAAASKKEAVSGGRQQQLRDGANLSVLTGAEERVAKYLIPAADAAVDPTIKKNQEQGQ